MVACTINECSTKCNEFEATENKVHIVIIEDHVLYRQSLVGFLQAQPNFEVVGQSSTADDGIQLVSDTNPDVIILDVEVSGLKAQDFLRQLPPQRLRKVILLTSLSDIHEVACLLQVGVRGVFSKTSGAGQLTSAILRMMAGEIWVDQVYLRALVAAAAEAATPAPQPHTSVREYEILQLVGRGESNKAIAGHLKISESGVKAGLQRLFRKHVVGNRAQLVAVSGPAPAKR